MKFFHRSVIFWTASQSGFTEITKKLLEAGANTDFAEEVNGDTALIFGKTNQFFTKDSIC